MGGSENLRDLLRKDPGLAGTELLKHSGEIRMTRHTRVENRFYAVEGKCDLLGRNQILDRRRQHDNWRVQIVARG
jgi:hypothetical protein